MLTRRSVLSVPAVAGLLLPSSVTVRAEESPTGRITFIDPFPPGGSIDVVLRVMAPKLQERLDQPIVIESRPGAGGVIATAAVAKAAPDGHTFLVAASALAANPKLFKTLPFDTLKDLQAITLLFRTPLVLVVNPSLPVRSVTELIALLKEKPGQINFGHSGLGAAIHLAPELFQTMTGTKMNGVAYRGAPPALNDVMAGHIALMFADAGTVIGQISEGRVRALGVSSTTRVPVMPDVPTIAEAGVPGFDAVGWSLVCAPSATPKPIIDRLHTELAAVTAMPDVRELIIKFGTIPVDSPSPEELQKFLATEIGRWGDLIERAGLANSL